MFGEIDPVISDRAEKLLLVFQRAGWNVELSDNAIGIMWRKFIFLAGTAGVNAVTQADYDEMRTTPETRETIRVAYQEAIDVGKASGVPVEDDTLEWALGQLDGFPGTGMSSLANDFRNGNRVELEGLIGTIVRLGGSLGVPTPVNSTLYALLKPAANRIGKSLAP